MSQAIVSLFITDKNKNNHKLLRQMGPSGHIW